MIIKGRLLAKIKWGAKIKEVVAKSGVDCKDLVIILKPKADITLHQHDIASFTPVDSPCNQCGKPQINLNCGSKELNQDFEFCLAHEIAHYKNGITAVYYLFLGDYGINLEEIKAHNFAISLGYEMPSWCAEEWKEWAKENGVSLG